MRAILLVFAILGAFAWMPPNSLSAHSGFDPDLLQAMHRQQARPSSSVKRICVYPHRGQPPSNRPASLNDQRRSRASAKRR